MAATGAPLGYLWYFNLNPISGATSPSYTINGVSQQNVGNYLCAVSNADGTVDTNTVTLAVVPALASAYTISTFAGSPGVEGESDGAASAASFHGPTGVAVDASGNVFVADSFNGVIRKVTGAGQVSTLAGSAGNLGHADGIGAAARFGEPLGIAVDSGGNLYVTDVETIRKITPSGSVSTLAGNPGVIGSSDGSGSAATFNDPFGIAVDGGGNVYVADFANNTIRKITASGSVSTIAGSAGVYGATDGVGTQASFYNPLGLVLDAGGNLFVTDSGNDLVRKISPSGVVTTIAGLAVQSGSADGSGSNARFNEPNGIALDPQGNLLVADTKNNSIRRVSQGGQTATVAGGGATSAYADGVGAAATFKSPYGITSDAQGRIYIADTGNAAIRAGIATPAPVITTQPASQVIIPDSTVVFSFAVTSSALVSYVWTLNGARLNDGHEGSSVVSGSRGPNLVILGADVGNAGSYSCSATGLAGVATSETVTLSVTATSDPGRLVNLSCRAVSESGSNQLIAGFVVGGPGTNGPLDVLIRASGPGLNGFGVNGTIPDPQLTLETSVNGANVLVDADAGWDGSTGVSAAAAAVGAFPWTDLSSTDSALVETLQEGAYTAQVTGVANDSGVALAEVYDATPAGTYTVSTPRLVNISTRVEVGTGGNILIAGFVIGGTTSKTVLIRGTGPTLKAFGLSGTLPDPDLTLNRSNGDGSNTVLQVNTGWGGNTQIAAAANAVGAFSWALDSADSAILVTLPPGAYTAEIAGASRDSGIALVEVYEVP